MEKITIEFKYKLGSKFQEDCFMKAVKTYTEAVANFYRNTHKKNKILLTLK